MWRRSSAARRDSSGYLCGALVPQSKPCPPGVDDWSDITGSVLDTFNAFPAGPFSISYRFDPADADLVAGTYHHCAYLIDRGSQAVLASGVQDLTVRKAHVQISSLKLPRHLRFYYDTIGRPTARVTISVRIGVEVPGRELLVTFERAGSSCAGRPDEGEFGGVDPAPRVKAGKVRSYRMRALIVMHPGKLPYGRKVRACVAVAWFDDHESRYVTERQAKATLRLRR